MEYVRKRLYTLHEVGYTCESKWLTEDGDYANLTRNNKKDKGNYISVGIRYVIYSNHYKNKLNDTLYEDDERKMVMSYVTLNNRRVILEKYKGYKEYSKYL